MARLSVPTKAKLSSSLRVESSHPAVVKSLGRLSRDSLISLALDWLEEHSLPLAAPYLVPARDDQDEAESDNDDPDDLYPPCRSLARLRAIYTDLQVQKGAKREVVTRILEGDWRHGLSLYQLAMVDFQYLDEHPASQTWTAYAVLPLMAPSKDADEPGSVVDDKSLTIPRFHPSTFLHNFQQQLLPDVKAHYHFHRPKLLPVLLLRVFVIDSPYNTNMALTAAGPAASFSSSRTVYMAFPDGSPSLYITKSQATGPAGLGESKSLHSLIVNGVPKALSRPRERFTLKSTNLSSKNLEALLEKRGQGRANAAGGGWSIYADGEPHQSPLGCVLPEAPLATDGSHVDSNRKRHGQLTAPLRAEKRARLLARARFGTSAIVTDGKGVEKVELLVQDAFPASSEAPSAELSNALDEHQSQDRRRSKLDAALRQAQAEVETGEDEADASLWTPAVRLCFQGPHVFAGLRQLVEAGIVSGERMPGWMTGEERVTIGTIRHGRIRGYKGSGI